MKLPGRQFGLNNLRDSTIRHSEGDCCPGDELAGLEDGVEVEYEDEVGDGVETRFEIESVDGCAALEASSDSLYFGELT